MSALDPFRLSLSAALGTAVPQGRTSDDGDAPPSDEEALLRGMHAVLTRAVRRVCPPWLADRRDDLVQAGLMRALRLVRRERRQDAPPASYLWRVANSCLIDELRAQRRRSEVPLVESVGEDDGARAVQLADDGPDPERAVRAEELRRAFEACLRTMTASRRRPVALHLQGHPLREIATLLSLPPKRAENLTYRGLGDLRTCLTARGLGP